jgi:hypothetical protein
MTPVNDFHMKSRDTASISLLFAALEKSFPLFLRYGRTNVVDGGGKMLEQKVLHASGVFSTSFPQTPVDAEGQ